MIGFYKGEINGWSQVNSIRGGKYNDSVWAYRAGGIEIGGAVEIIRSEHL